jgi:hypothetical protein
MAAEVALDVIGRQLLQLLHHTNTGGFLLLLLESGKCNTICLPFITRRFPFAHGNRKSNTFNQFGNKEEERH